MLKETAVNSIVVAALIFGSMVQPAFADPPDDRSMPPAAGGGWHDSEAFDLWMEAVRNLRYLFGFSPKD